MSKPESRREYIKALGGQSAVMRALNEYYEEEVIKNRQTIDNWIDWGFAYEHREALKNVSLDMHVIPHPELLEEPEPVNEVQATPLHDFIHALAKAAGGFTALSKEFDIRESSLRKMCEKKSGVMPMHVPNLENAAGAYKVPLPDFWPEARTRHKEFIGRLTIGMVKRFKRLTTPNRDAT